MALRLSPANRLNPFGIRRYSATPKSAREWPVASGIRQNRRPLAKTGNHSPKPATTRQNRRPLACASGLHFSATWLPCCPQTRHQKVACQDQPEVFAARQRQLFRDLRQGSKAERRSLCRVVNRLSRSRVPFQRLLS